MPSSTRGRERPTRCSTTWWASWCGPRWPPAPPMGGSSSATPIPIGTCACVFTVNPGGSTPRCWPAWKQPWPRCWRRGSCGACSWTPTSGRSSATAATEASSWPSSCSPPTARPGSPSWGRCRGGPGRALAGVYLLFDGLGLALEEKRSVARRAREGFGREFGVDGSFRGRVGQRYWAERARLEALLAPGQAPPAPPLAAGLEALRQRSLQLAPVTAELRQLSQAGRLSATLAELARSCAHMHVNRLLRSAHRAQELVLYELLDRAYSSRAGRRSVVP